MEFCLVKACLAVWWRLDAFLWRLLLSCKSGRLNAVRWRIVSTSWRLMASWPSFPCPATQNALDKYPVAGQVNLLGFRWELNCSCTMTAGGLQHPWIEQIHNECWTRRLWDWGWMNFVLGWGCILDIGVNKFKNGVVLFPVRWDQWVLFFGGQSSELRLLAGPQLKDLNGNRLYPREGN